MARTWDGTLDSGASTASGPAGKALLPDRYEDLGRIDRGAMGEVRRVRDRVLGSELAMKIIAPEVELSPALERRFRSEARITAQLNHPGIVAVQDLGSLEDGRLWYTMELVEGRTLASVIDEVHAAARPEGWSEDPEVWSFRRLVDAFARACEAVAYAHAHGVIHRDLKAPNIMVGSFGELRVMDWGLARVQGEPDAPEASPPLPNEGTQVGQVMGTPAYMAPEQARGEVDRVDARSDVYALGALLYHLLSGRPPYPGSGEQAWRAVLSGPPASLESLGDRRGPCPPRPCA